MKQLGVRQITKRGSGVEGLGVSQPSASVCPVEIWVFSTQLDCIVGRLCFLFPLVFGSSCIRGGFAW